jgi:SAM-dependent methyltransferase
MFMSITWEEAVLWLRSQPEQQELVRACYYDDPVLESAMRYEASDEWQRTLPFLPTQKGAALDLGAGRGISSYSLAKAGWQVDALEPDSSEVVGRGAIKQIADQSKLPIHPLEGYAENIPAEDSKYQLVYGRQVLHHAQNLQKMCREVARVLKPGGVFVATREHVISRKEDLQAFLDAHPLHHLYGGENAFLLDEYLDALKAAGLSLKHVLAPFASPINYFPAKESDIRAMLQYPLEQKIGKRLVKLFAGESLDGVVNRLLCQAYSRNDQTPGRMYSFVAQKI